MIPLADFGDVLGSPVWTVLATLFTAAAIAVTVWLYRRQRPRKELSCDLQVTSLVNVHKAAQGRIRLLIDEEEVKRAHLVEVKLKNSGNIPIQDGEFERPISFDLGSGATAMAVDLVDIEPAELRPEIRVDGSEVLLMPLLLNPGDKLGLKMLVRNLTGRVECHYRIVGITKLVDERAQRPRQRRKWFSGAASHMRYTTLVAAVVSLVGVFVSAASLLWLEENTETTVQLTNGASLCGKVLQTSDSLIVLQLADGGAIRRLPLRQIESIEDKSC